MNQQRRRRCPEANGRGAAAPKARLGANSACAPCRARRALRKKTAHWARSRSDRAKGITETPPSNHPASIQQLAIAARRAAQAAISSQSNQQPAKKTKLRRSLAPQLPENRHPHRIFPRIPGIEPSGSRSCLGILRQAWEDAADVADWLVDRREFER